MLGRWADKGFLRLTETECTHKFFVDMNQILRELGRLVFNFNSADTQRGVMGRSLFFLSDALAGGSA